MQSFAMLGSHPELSLAEIQAVTGQKPTKVAGGIAVFEDLGTEPTHLMQKLGGTQKLGVIIGSVTDWDHQEMAAFLANDLTSDSLEGKVNFGISVYNMGNDLRTEIVRKAAGAVGIEVKTQIREMGRSARYVISREQTLSSVVIEKNDLLTKGAEYVLLVDKEEITIGKTVAIQNFEDWSTRDFGRPRRNAKQGMLPPKLARMMLNLAGEVRGKVVFDPFCGSGTVLMEAIELGAAHVIGSDIAEMAMKDTEENLKWLETQGKEIPMYELHVAPAAQAATKVLADSVDILATETYLGRPRKGKETVEDVKNTIHYVSNVYRESFYALRPTLKDDATLIVAAPIHDLGGETFELPAIKILEELGYKFEPTDYEPLIYQHKGQLVGRRILRFKAKQKAA